MTQSTIRRIRGPIKAHFQRAARPRKAKYRVPLSVPTYDWQEAVEAIDSLLSMQVTMGAKVKTFEKMFASYVGASDAVMVNSGSSANLLAMSILSNPMLEKPLKPGDEVITPAVTWSTTVFPIVGAGCVPVFVDIDLETLTVDPDEVSSAVSDTARAIFLVHLLGNPCAMHRIVDVARQSGLYVVEDACEAIGAKINGKCVGSFGDLGTFSFYFSHHISTIEGGMLVTSNGDYADLARVMRAHGWVRNSRLAKDVPSKYPDIDPRFLFISLGYNLRPMEIQGAFGIHQLRKLERFIEHRRRNSSYLIGKLSRYKEWLILPRERNNSRHVWFGFPLVVRKESPFTRKDLTEFLEGRRIETRPIMAGNFVEQPVASTFKHRTVGDLSNSKLIMRNGFFFGNHSGVGRAEREVIVEAFEDFMSERGIA